MAVKSEGTAFVHSTNRTGSATSCAASKLLIGTLLSKTGPIRAIGHDPVKLVFRRAAAAHRDRSEAAAGGGDGPAGGQPQARPARRRGLRAGGPGGRRAQGLPAAGRPVQSLHTELIAPLLKHQPPHDGVTSSGSAGRSPARPTDPLPTSKRTSRRQARRNSWASGWCRHRATRRTGSRAGRRGRGGTTATIGLGRIVALCCRSSPLYHNH